MNHNQGKGIPKTFNRVGVNIIKHFFMKKIKIIVASLALIFAVASSFTTVDQTFSILGIDKDIQLPSPAPADIPEWYDTHEFTTVQSGLTAIPPSATLDLLKSQRCTNTGKVCLVVIEYEDGEPVAVADTRLGDYIGS